MTLFKLEAGMTGTRVGVISDTHGLLRAEAVEMLKGSDHILHAGDIGKPDVLDALNAIAPVTAVRGNNDRGAWADSIPEHQIIEIGTVSIYMLHDVKQLDVDMAHSKFQVVISGHSHKPDIQERDGVIFLNPGSAGPKRFKLPITVAQMTIVGPKVSAAIVNLAV